MPQIFCSRYFPTPLESSRNWRRQFKIALDDEIIFTKLLQQSGYYTAAFTAHSFYPQEGKLAAAFDEYHYVNPKRKSSYAEADRMIEESIRWIKINRGKNYFLYIHLMDTHFPHFIRKGYRDWITGKLTYRAIEKTLDWIQHEPDFYSDELKKLFSDLHDMSIRYTDDQLARLFNYLRNEGLIEDTLIIITADHGEELGEYGALGHGYSLRDEELHVPLIIHYPRGFPQARRVDFLT